MRVTGDPDACDAGNDLVCTGEGWRRAVGCGQLALNGAHPPGEEGAPTENEWRGACSSDAPCYFRSGAELCEEGVVATRAEERSAAEIDGVVEVAGEDDVAVGVGGDGVAVVVPERAV